MFVTYQYQKPKRSRSQKNSLYYSNNQEYQECLRLEEEVAQNKQFDNDTQAALEQSMRETEEAELIRSVISDPHQLRLILQELPGVNPDNIIFQKFTNGY